ncbi:sensor histidine kinase [Bacillus sp. sid0103]|uniref:sensor histidine kinase n=1 Tax=Bacillus sp. sid0103 TaxID=2856337 RepID=UPI001C464CA2|nr:sensor histidine kinase [Bacillus sp. sid0103]MBV7504957.1 sensor histidine kinase [Bacillus sp. sid0103]
MIKTEMNTVVTLCQLHTDLSEQDIQKIQEVVQNLQLIADLNQANVFVDCQTREKKHAIVVAEAAPGTANSVYKNPVVGKFAYETFEPAVFYAFRTGKPLFLNHALTQEGKKVEQSVVPIVGIHNRVIGTLIMEKDNSDKLQNQNKLKALTEANETLSELLLGMAENRPFIPEVIEEALFIIDEDLRIQYSNPAAMNLVLEMCSKECKSGKLFTSYFPNLAEMCRLPDELVIQEIIIQNKVFQMKKIALVQHEKNSGSFIIFRDLTELREKERELTVKTVAIREIHHRVKNNLQTVASLLRLQMRRGVPEESKFHFIKSLNRIVSIASVYEIILSNSENQDDVELVSLIEKIGNMLVFSEDHEGKLISIVYSGPKIFIKSNLAVSVALVINELIQNCVKHAFSEMTEGQIDVVIQEEASAVRVLVMDNGIGYTPSMKPSLGLDIVKMMIEHDLTGHFSIEGTSEGTEVTVEFPFAREG